MVTVLRRVTSCNWFITYRALSTSDIRADKFREDLLAEIRAKIAENKKALQRFSFSHHKSRGLVSCTNNLSQAMQNVQQKMVQAPANTIANIPAYVHIEVLGNGTCHMRPCIAIRTPLKVYMFNCPEGTSRFLPQLRMKSLNVMDIFVTRATWDNIAGISSILLSKESNALPSRLHGAVNIKHFLECIRPFNDADYGATKYPSQVDERPYTMDSYEDAGAKVTYMALSPALGTETNKKYAADVAYLVELKAPARRIDPLKLISMQVPKGPLIGRLKNGQSIKLPNGDIVRPEDVYASDAGAANKNEKPRVLIAECSTIEHVNALAEHSSFTQFTKEGSPKLDFMVHLSSPSVMETPAYTQLVASLGDSCQHIVVNEKCPVIPGVESIYRNHRLLRHLCPSVFPALQPAEWAGLVTQGNELERRDGAYTYAAPLQRFTMRAGGNEEPIIADLRDGDLELNDDAEKMVEELRQAEQDLDKNCEFPRVSFLGTSSAVPSKYRNVTGYLMETGPDSALMVDCGEGSYGQMKVILGTEQTHRMMLKLRAVFVTHAHQDHMNGLYTVIKRRQEAYEREGLPYVPLVLVTTRNVLKPLQTYSMCFEDISSLLEIVDISRHPVTPPSSPGPPNKRRRLPSPTLSATRDVIPELPAKLFSKEKWNIQECKAVQVHHTRMANGFVFRANGKLVVFSGDTKPCDLLVEEGKGADLLIHEATFEDGHEADAQRKKHSTMGQAVDVGRRMSAKHIILTHFSARYPKVPDLPDYLDEYGNVGVAMDNMSVRFDHLPLVPKLIPIYREVYQEELFEIELRKDQRELKAKAAKEALENAKKPKTRNVKVFERSLNMFVTKTVDEQGNVVEKAS